MSTSTTPNEKSCENCRYFYQHYFKSDSTYRPVFFGHCFHKRNKKLTPRFLCEQWEDIAIKNEERKKSIKVTLESMAQNLNEIAMILKDEKEND